MNGRRRVLLAGLAGFGVLGAGTVGVLEDLLPGGASLRRALGMVGPTGTVPSVPPVHIGVHRLTSATRGREVDLVTMIPPGVEPSTLPVCLVLHGRGNTAQGMVDLGLPRFLSAAVRAGVPPFAMVAVDGGDAYWVARSADDDPQAMLRTELPGWLADLGLTSPRTVLGISMGCFGALTYTRHRDTPPAAVAVLSPALFRRWSDARSVAAFPDESRWAANEPLNHLDALPPDLRLGVWCGTEDPFHPAAQQLADRAHPTVAAFDHGEHTESYWRRVLPEALRFLGGGR